MKIFSFINSSPDFMIHGLFSYKLFGYKFWITTTHLNVFIISLLIIFFAFIFNRKIKKEQEKSTSTQSTFQNVLEYIIEFLDSLINSSMDKYSDKFKNYICSIFVFILVSNLSGLLGLHQPTADYGITFALALISFILIEFAAWRHNTKETFKGLFQPIFLFLPINIISEFAVLASLSLRLFGNIISGTVIMALLYSLLPFIITSWGIPGLLHIYFDIFSGIIQTYVFCMLTMTFIRNKYND